MVKYTARGLVVKRPGVLSKVHMQNLVLGGGGLFPSFKKTRAPTTFSSGFGWLGICKYASEEFQRPVFVMLIEKYASTPVTLHSILLQKYASLRMEFLGKSAHTPPLYVTYTSLSGNLLEGRGHYSPRHPPIKVSSLEAAKRGSGDSLRLLIHMSLIRCQDHLPSRDRAAEKRLEQSRMLFHVLKRSYPSGWWTWMGRSAQDEQNLPRSAFHGSY